jgi:hypothetical protein
MTGHRKPATDRTVKRMPRNAAVAQRSRMKKIQDQPEDPGTEAGTDVNRDRPDADNPPNALIRRQIEMYREAQLLRQHLTDSYDP